HANGLQALHEPVRRRPHGNSAYDRGHVPRATFFVFHAKREAAAGKLSPAFCSLQRWPVTTAKFGGATNGIASCRSDLSRQANMREKVRPVRQDVHHDPYVANGQYAQQRRSRRGVHAEFQNSFVITSEPEF